MTTIRPFSERDIPEVVSLYEREIRSGTGTPPPRLGEYFRRTFLEHPWTDPEIPSLVSESTEGRVVGFLGSHVRRFRFDGRPIRLACSGQLVTEPAVRHQAAGAFLLRDYLAGPQELTITDGANEPARRLWEGLGGDTLHVNCIDWIRVFRPVGVGLEYAMRGRGTGLSRMVAPPLAMRLGRGRGAKRLTGTAEELTPESLVANLQELAPAFRLYPDYDVAFAEWLFREMAAVQTRGQLIRSLVRADGGRVVGWYVAYVKKGGVSDVVQVATTGRTSGVVLDHLFREAAEHGASAVRGRLQSRLLPALSVRSRFLRYAGGALAHSRSDEIMHVLRSNDSLLTRMDGEWWMGHHLEPFEEDEGPRLR
jgi:hypothetical protein